MQISVTQNSDSICVSVSGVSVFVPGCRLPLSACYCFQNSCCYGKQQQLLGRQTFMVKIVTITLTWLLLVRASASCFEGTGEATLLHHQDTACICSLASLTESVCDSKLKVLLSSNCTRLKYLCACICRAFAVLSDRTAVHCLMLQVPLNRHSVLPCV